MSTSYTAYAVIGVMVNKSHLYRLEVHPHTEHTMPAGAMFCPTCGKEAYFKTLTPLFDEDTMAIGPFPMIESWSDDRVAFGYVADEQDFYVNWKPDEKKSRDLPLPDIEELKHQLRHYLGPLDLWHEETFGLHAILYIS